MELHYIWIKKFRNLENKHLNFTGKYSLDISEDGIINLHERKTKIDKGFFGSNISNISAIIGKNGSGKSNIMELINYLLYTPKSVDSDFIFIYSGEGGLWGNNTNVVHKLFDRKYNLDINDDYNKISFEEFKLDSFNLVFFSNISDGVRKRLPAKTIDISNNSLPSGTSRYKEDFFLAEIDFFENEKYIDFSFAKPELIQVKNNAYNSAFYRKYREFDTDDCLGDYRNRINKSQSTEVFYYWISYYLILETIDDLVNKDSHSEQTQIFEDSKEFRRGIKKFLKDILKIEDLRKKYSFIISEFPLSLIENSKTKTNIQNLIILLKDAEYGRSIINDIEGKRNTRTDSFFIPFNSNSRGFVEKCLKGFVKIKPFNFSWFGLSSGHRAFLNLYARFIKISKESQAKNTLVLIDEGDLYFHPQWQKEYLKKIINLFELEYNGRKVQLILTSHSPFIVSDLPKSNILFLSDEKEQEDLANIPETFGANILDLYRSTFFLKNGTVSDFANEKLDKIISQAINNIKENREITSDIDLIGDRLIKTQLLNLQKNSDDYITNN